MASDCIFCRIVNGEMDADILYQDEQVTAFWDHSPAAPVHVLIVPNKHIPSINEVEAEDAELLGKMILVAKNIAKEKGVDKSGYRLVINVGQDGGQTVYHLHLHIVGGERLPVFER
jgi:histidine triad (HIT) family protein